MCVIRASLLMNPGNWQDLMKVEPSLAMFVTCLLQSSNCNAKALARSFLQINRGLHMAISVYSYTCILYLASCSSCICSCLRFSFL